MKPFIDHNGERYAFKATRATMKDIARLQSRHLTADGKIDSPFDFLDEVAYSLFESNHGLNKAEVDVILDEYNPDNPAEIYEFLGAVVETLFTPQAGTQETKNQFLAEYRRKKTETAEVSE